MYSYFQGSVRCQENGLADLGIVGYVVGSMGEDFWKIFVNVYRPIGEFWWRVVEAIENMQDWGGLFNQARIPRFGLGVGLCVVRYRPFAAKRLKRPVSNLTSTPTRRLHLIRPAPHDRTVTQEEVRAAAVPSPHRWDERWKAVAIKSDIPLRGVVR
jgi:hypothetical protein